MTGKFPDPRSASFGESRGMNAHKIPRSSFAAISHSPHGAHAYTLQQLYSFCGSSNGEYCTDGSDPVAGVVLDGSGNLYGTTQAGGTNNDGTIFELVGKTTHTILYNFCPKASCADGEAPVAAPILDSSGNLSGTTYSAVATLAQGAGAVFKLTPGGTESLLYAFCGSQCSVGDDGLEPVAGLLMDSSGNLYSTTALGGTNDAGGEVFELEN